MSKNLAKNSKDSSKESRRKTKRSRCYCPHCDEYLCKSLYYQHRQQHYDFISKKWRKESQDSACVGGSFVSPIDIEFSPYSETRKDINVEHSNDKEFYSSDEEVADDIEKEPNECLNSNAFSNEIHCQMEFEEIEMELNEIKNADESDEDNPNKQHEKVVHALILFLFLWQSLFRVSNNALTLMLAFIKQFILFIGRLLKTPAIITLSETFPNSLYKAKKYLGTQKDNFVKYVSCPTCHSVYTLKDAIHTESDGTKTSRTCSYVCFPQHIQSRMRKQCGSLLLKTMKSSKSSIYLMPISVYCYRNPIGALQELLNRTNMLQLCEHWRNRDVLLSSNGKIRDIYDGNMWNHFQFDSDGQPFLAAQHNYILILNCDWFQPYKHTQFSVGVLYLAVANLPREIRFLKENILVVGIIPGPSEPSKTINTYLEPLVADLKLLWKGVEIIIGEKRISIRAALSCLASDVPAARKVGGFVGHNAKLGCNRCLKTFSVESFGDYPDYSGFNKSDWEMRMHAVHVWFALQQKKSKTKEEKKTIEGMHGARYSTLYELPYYNAISSCIVDPMHCLFLGIAKHFFKVWLSCDKLQTADLINIQAKVDSFKSPCNIGRIPYKFASNVSGLKADQWKNWTMYFSLYALKGLLPHRDYNCWLIFVKVCTKICQRELSINELQNIDALIQSFCEKFEELYGKKNLTPNLHLIAHITDCIRDHGPVYAFWLYAFERLNGVLGALPTSQHDITTQLMRKLSYMQSASMEHWPSELRNEFSFLIQPYIKESGSLLETLSPNFDDLHVSLIPIPPLLEKAFDESSLSAITSLVSTRYSPSHTIEILRLHKKTNAVSFSENTKLASAKSNYSNCSKVFVNSVLMEIDGFVEVAVIVSNLSEESDSSQYVKYWLACGSSYMEHPCKVWFGYPTEVWSSVLNNDFHYFFINEISNRSVFVDTLFNFGGRIGQDKVLVVTPIPFYV